MKTISIVLTVFFVLFFSFSCKKNQLGGKAIISGKVVHHSKPIPNAVVYIKFNATEFAGSDYKAYNTSVNANALGEYSIAVYKGDYYLYAVGIDTDNDSLVRGGIPVSIRNNENLTKTIAVTE